MEGANEIKVYLSILPVIWPALLTFGFIHFIMAWNEHLIPLIILQSPDLQTLNLALSNLMDSSLGRPLAVIMAGAMFTTFPVVILFAFMYRRIKSSLSDLIIQ